MKVWVAYLAECDMGECEYETLGVFSSVAQAKSALASYQDGEWDDADPDMICAPSVIYRYDPESEEFTRRVEVELQLSPYTLNECVYQQYIHQ